MFPHSQKVLGDTQLVSLQQQKDVADNNMFLLIIFHPAIFHPEKSFSPEKSNHYNMLCRVGKQSLQNGLSSSWYNLEMVSKNFRSMVGDVPNMNIDEIFKSRKV